MRNARADAGGRGAFTPRSGGRPHVPAGDPRTQAEARAQADARVHAGEPRAQAQTSDPRAQADARVHTGDPRIQAGDPRAQRNGTPAEARAGAAAAESGSPADEENVSRFRDPGTGASLASGSGMSAAARQVARSAYVPLVAGGGA